jgi:hypothetical protein
MAKVPQGKRRFMTNKYHGSADSCIFFVATLEGQKAVETRLPEHAIRNGS